jgi:predicted ATP-grasp superfamily ATP-dependent carboligase
MTSAKNREKSILLVGNYGATLPSARLLSEKGYRVIAGIEDGSWCEIDYWRSRFISETWNHPPGKSEPESFFDLLKAYCREHPEVEAIFPVMENYVHLFAAHSEWHAVLPPLIMLDPSLVLQCVDKYSLMKLVREHSIPIAPFTQAHDEEEFRQAVKTIGFPMVIRPTIASVALCNQKAVIARSQADIDKLRIDWNLHAKGVILQRKVKGMRYNVAFTAFDKKICRSVHSVVLRTNRHDYTGVAVEGLSMEPDDRLIQYTEKLIQALGYNGIGGAQYIVNDETGEISFLEINPRLSSHLTYLEYAGLKSIDFLMDLCLADKPDPTSFTCRAGIRYTWISEDIVAAKTAWRKKQISNAEAVRWLGRIVLSALRTDIDIFLPEQDRKPGLLAVARAMPGVSRLINQKPRS